MRLLLLALLAVTASAQPDEAPEPLAVELVGYVYDADVGEPLAGANVWIASLERGAAADIEGRYVYIRTRARCL